MASSSRPAPTGSSGHVLALFGPTASGKTAVAGLLRGLVAAEVVSADSAALYAGLPILTAVPSYPARLVGTVPLREEVSVGSYQRLAHEAIDGIAAAGRLPLVAGGTGLYLRAAVGELELPPPAASERRAFWEAEYERLGPAGAHELLAERDPAAAARVHANDRKRVVRALELAESGASLAPREDRLWSEHMRLPTVVVGLDVPLDELDRRIEARTRAMVAGGVVEEARAAWAEPRSRTASQVLGLEEFATLPTPSAVERVVQATKRLARYQRKWLRRLPIATTLDGSLPVEELADQIVALERSGEHLPRHRGDAASP
ncbi:MAG TPA: tRNA (adenosine(37)-N6)-dimethylallyltransferase MiaA [Gaiellaceae bacterium]